MMRLIDVDALRKRIEKAREQAKSYGGYDVLSGIDVIRYVDEAPTIDAVPVVRCKDCVSYNNHFSQKGFGWCEEETLRIVNDNFYCGNAVKKGEEVNDRDAD